MEVLFPYNAIGDLHASISKMSESCFYIDTSVNPALASTLPGINTSWCIVFSIYYCYNCICLNPDLKECICCHIMDIILAGWYPAFQSNSL